MIKIIEFSTNDLHPDPSDKWIGGFAITTNIASRIKEIPYLKYHRWQISVNDGLPENSTIEYEDDRELVIKLYIDYSSIDNCRKPDDIAKLYQLLFESFEYIWGLKKWNSKDLMEIHETIIREGYRSVMIHEKSLQSPNKKLKGQFFCELFPDYSVLHFQFIEKDGSVRKTIEFFKTHIDPNQFFGFFANRHWRNDEHFILSDINKEIFFIFSVNDDTFNIHYKPQYNSPVELENYVKAFRSETPYDEMMRLLQLPMPKK